MDNMTEINRHQNKLNGFKASGLSKQYEVSHYAKLYFYRSKIRWLEGEQHPQELLLLACRDAPVSPGDLSRASQKRSYVKKCLKYYNKKLDELNGESKKRWWNFGIRFF